MKTSEKIMLGVAIGSVSCFVIDAIKKHMQKKVEEESVVDEFWADEHVQQTVENAEKKADELLNDLATEANDYIASFEKDLYEQLEEHFKRQEDIRKRYMDRRKWRGC